MSGRKGLETAAAGIGLTLWVRRTVPGTPVGAGAGASAREVKMGPEVPGTPAGAGAEAGSPEPAPSPPAPPPSPGEEEGRAWAALEAEVASCTRCALARGRTRTVFGIGDRRARWLLVGEGPGRDEDLRGEPFVGRAGQLLGKMLEALGLTRERVYIANVVKCRPPDNRTPLEEECAACLPYLERQIALVRPALVLALGRVAAQGLLRTAAPLSALRGRVLRYEGAFPTPLVVTYHPAYLLRQPTAKAEAWRDLRLAARSVPP